MKILHCILCALLWIVSTQFVLANVEIHSTQLTTVNGLSDNTVRHIYQDSKGFLWIATLNGLNRYDGNSFIKYYPEDTSISLSNHRIKKVIEDPNGFLWINTFSETFSCYSLKEDRFIDCIGTGDHHLLYKEILLQDDAVWLWGNSDGFARIVYEEGKFTPFFWGTRKGTLNTDHILSIEEGRENDIYVRTDKGLYYWKNDSLKQLSNLTFIKSLFYKQSAVFITSDGEIWTHTNHSFEKIGEIPLRHQMIITDALNIQEQCIIFTSSESFLFNMRTGQTSKAPSHYHVPNGIVTKDNHHNYWVQNGSGNLQYIHAESGETKIFTLIPQEKHSLLSREQYHVLHDSRNLIWITTYGNGVFVYNPITQELRQFTANGNRFSCLASNFLLNIMEDRSGNIWIGTEHCGISHVRIMNEGSKRIYPTDLENNWVRMISQMDSGDICVGIRNGGSFVYNSNLSVQKSKNPQLYSVYAVVEDEIGEEWIGTREIGLLAQGRKYRMSTKPDSLSNDAIFTILRDRKNRMWVGTFGGWLNLAVPDKDGVKFRQIHIDEYGQRWIRCLIEDRNGWIWAGTSGGVLVFQPDSLIASSSQYYCYSRSDKSLKSNEIRSIFQDSTGRIWIAESGAGFSVCIPDGHYNNLSFKHYNASNGLVNNKVQAFAEDQQGLIWISTEYGISCFNPQEETFDNYFFSNDILENVYSDNCAITLNDGRLAFGSNQGIVVIDPQKVEKKRNIPMSVTFTDLKINGISVHPGDKDSPLQHVLAYTTSLTLKHNQNSFAVEFSALDYPESNPTNFSYILENYEKEWSVPSSLNFAAYKNLPPGTYHLHVRTCNVTGQQEQNEAVLSIIVEPPFWATKGAIIVYIILLVIVFYIIMRIIVHMNALKNKIEIEKQLTEYKLVFFTNISHEFRTPLTLILGALEKLSNIKNIPNEAYRPMQSMNKSSKRMLRLVNQLLEFRKMQNGKLSLSVEETDIISFLYDRFLDFNDVAEQKGMDYKFLSSMESYYMYIDQEKVDKIVYNLLSNAFKYTPEKGQVTFSISINEKTKECNFQISDTGVGIPKNKRKDLFKRFTQSNLSNDSIGIGLHLSHELVQIHKGNISYKENEGGGSIFSVCLPTDSSLYTENDFVVVKQPQIQREEEKLEWNINSKTDLSEPLNKRKILIIEDDNEIRNLLKEEIGQYFEVETASDGNKGLNIANSTEFDLIVCDVLMPGLTGFEVTKKLKSDFKTSHVPVILLTALDSPEKRLEGIENGADAYIPKPFSLKYVLTRIFQLIEQRDKLREKFSKEPVSQHETLCFTNKDKVFLEKLTDVLEKNISRPDFSVEEFASLMKLSKTSFYSKVKGVTGFSPVEYLRVVRLKKAASILIINKTAAIAEVAYQIGFNDPLYFSKCFKQQFGVSPSNYQKENGTVESL